MHDVGFLDSSGTKLNHFCSPNPHPFLTLIKFRNLKISRYINSLNDLCETWSHGRHLVVSCIAPRSKSFTLPNEYDITPNKLLIVLMGFPRLGVALYHET